MDKPLSTLQLDSQLTELIRVQEWVDELADRQGLRDETRFAVQLCMEEALANVVIHGYRGQRGSPIVIRTWISEGSLYFAIEDKAPTFAPSLPGLSNAQESPNLENMTPGGNGIRLMHRFAGSMAYERLAEGNRLILGFPFSAKNDLSV